MTLHTRGFARARAVVDSAWTKGPVICVLRALAFYSAPLVAYRCPLRCNDHLRFRVQTHNSRLSTYGSVVLSDPRCWIHCFFSLLPHVAALAQALCRVTTCCTAWKTAAASNEDKIWRLLCLGRFNMNPSELAVAMAPKEAYKVALEAWRRVRSEVLSQRVSSPVAAFCVSIFGAESPGCCACRRVVCAAAAFALASAGPILWNAGAAHRRRQRRVTMALHRVCPNWQTETNAGRFILLYSHSHRWHCARSNSFLLPLLPTPTLRFILIIVVVNIRVLKILTKVHGLRRRRRLRAGVNHGAAICVVVAERIRCAAGNGHKSWSTHTQANTTRAQLR